MLLIKQGRLYGSSASLYQKVYNSIELKQYTIRNPNHCKTRYRYKTLKITD